MPHTPRPGDVLISLTNGEELGSGCRVIGLRIEDELTGRFLVDIDLDGPELTTLIGGRHIRTGGLLVQLQYLLTGETLGVHVEIHETSPVRPVFEVRIGGEDFAAILGNKVTRVSGATIYQRASR